MTKKFNNFKYAVLSTQNHARMSSEFYNISTINPWCACAARITVVVSCVCVCVCVYVISFLPPRTSRPQNIGAYGFTATQRKYL